VANVFISHRGVDAVDAGRLATDLTGRGHDVRLDDQIAIGDSIVAWMNDGLSGMMYLVLCCSGAGPSSWMDREWMSTLARQLDGAPVRILPVLLAGGVLPVVIRDLRYADLAADWSSGVDALCAAMR
jgi:hypothetical protein